MSENHRARLKKFYEKYNPSKASDENLDRTLVMFHGREEAMWSLLRDQYDCQSDAIDEITSAETPNHVAFHPEAIFRQCSQRVAMDTEAVPSDDEEERHRKSTKRRLEAFYRMHDPSKLKIVPRLLELCAANEELVFAALVDQYGPEPNEAVGGQSTSATAPMPLETTSSMRRRLIRFYNHWCY